MQHYGLSEVEKLLQLPRSTIRSLVKAGFVAPSRGPRNTLLFSFQDLVVLRRARALIAARVPARRIVRAMKSLVETAGSGQYSLAFEGERGGALKFERKKAGGDDWFGKALALEGRNPEAALAAYQRAIEATPDQPGAYVNLGRLLFESGRRAKAERAYRDGIAACGSVPLLHYNLGVLLDDAGRRQEAIRHYEEALRGDPAFADCHYNLALLCEELGRAREAIRHLAQYRKLTRPAK
ncbi:MAG TPA: tetratricopeptide repeat protein [Burkholderiales bacterium]|nr:tetratricopeptide repeat protein [Burkholderiales bacterium]